MEAGQTVTMVIVTQDSGSSSVILGQNLSLPRRYKSNFFHNPPWHPVGHNGVHRMQGNVYDVKLVHPGPYQRN